MTKTESNQTTATDGHKFLIGGYTVNKYKRILQLVVLFAGGFVAGSLIVAVFTLGFRAITAV